MKKEFTANILFLVGINLLIKPFYSLVIDTSVQNRVGPEEYGLYFALFNFVYIQQIFADLGVQNYNNRTIAQHPEKLSDLLPKILGSKIIFTLAFILIILCSSMLFGYGQYLNEILVYIIGTQASLSFLLYCRSNISGMGKYYVDSIFSVLDKLILIIWLSVLLFGGSESSDGFQVIDFVKVQFYSISITLFLSFIYIHWKLNRISIQINWTFMLDLLKASLPYATLVILMAGYSRIDGIMLEQLIQDNSLEAGKYASSFRLYDTFNNFTFLFAVLLLPMFSKLIINKKAIKDLVIWSFKLLTLASLFIIMISFYYGMDLLSFFYTAEIDSTYTRSLLYLMLAGLPLSLNYIYGTLLTANGSLKFLNIIALSGFFLNVVLNYFLIPQIGAVGAAFATLITQMLVFVFQFVKANKLFKIVYSQEMVIRIGAVFFIGNILFYLTINYLSLKWGIGLLIISIAYIIMAFLLKILQWKDFKIWEVVKS